MPIDDDSDDEDHGEVNQNAAEAASTNKTNGVKRPLMDDDIITLSDSETEEPEAKRAMYSPPSSPDSDIIVLSDVE